MLLWRDQGIRTSFWKIKVKQTAKIKKNQQNLCKKLLRKTKKLYFHSLNTKNITDSGTYWQTVGPLVSKGEKILFNEGEKHISDDKKIWTIFNSFFSDDVADLKIPNHWNYLSQKNRHSLPTTIETLILNIKKGNLDSVFHLETTQEEV